MSQQPQDRYERYRGFNIFVKQDDCGGDGPRDWDNLGTMVCFHPRYILGDTGGNPKYRKRRKMWQCGAEVDIPQFEEPQDFIDYIQGDKDDNVALSMPLYLYDHGNIAMSTSRIGWPFSSPWDCGQVGWIYVTTEVLLYEYHNTKALDMSTDEGAAEAMERATRVLTGEVKAYSQFLSGNVWGYIVEDTAGEHLGSCWGYYGRDFKTNGLLEGARGEVDWYITQAYQRRAELVKAWIRNRVPHIYRTPMDLALSP